MNWWLKIELPKILTIIAKPKVSYAADRAVTNLSGKAKRSGQTDFG